MTTSTSSSQNPYSHSGSGPGATSGKPVEALPGVPTNVRFGVLGFSITMSILLYLDRFALSVAQPVMKKELNLDDQQMGYAQGAFFFTYALAQVPAGWLSQKYGPRLTLGLYVFIWSLAFGGMGLVTGLWSLILFRGVLGLAQAGAYPCAGSFLKQWFPVEGRGFANSFTAMGGRLGNLLSNVLTPYLMVLAGTVFAISTGTWRPVFMTYAALGVFWAIGFWFWFRNTPHEHPACNDAERGLITGEKSLATTPPATSPMTERQRSSFEAMLLSPTVWVMCAINFLVNVGWIFLATFLVTFLKKKFPTLELVTIGWLAAAPGLASMCGGLSGGIATDRLVSRFGLRWGRRLTGIIATSGAAIAYLLSLQAESYWAYICLFAAVGFMIDFGLGSLWAVYQDIAGKNVATVLGFANMCGNLAAFFFATVIGGFAKSDDWQSVFVISSIALFLTMICWFFVDPEKKLTADA